MFKQNFIFQFDFKISNIGVIYDNVRQGDIPYTCASIDKIKSVLNYEPLFTFEEGLNNTIKYYENRNKSN